MATKLLVYPAHHPVTLAIAGIVAALFAGGEIFQALAEEAARVDVAIGSEPFNEAAELAGVPYCRVLDLYVDRATKRRADGLHFTEAHLALCG